MLVRCDYCIDYPASVRQTTPFHKYSEVIKSKYMQQRVVQNDWPPPVGQEYYGKLALVEKIGFSSEKKMSWYMLRGKMDEFVEEQKTKVDIVDILKPMKQNIMNLKVVIDGPPGIGKTALCRKLCNMWAKGDFEHLGYKLMLFCPVRLEKVSSATTLHDLLCCIHENHYVPHCVNWVEQSKGEGVVFIFDGWDELSDEHKKSSLISKIISGQMLYNCSVIVTLRTYAYSSLIDMTQEHNMGVHKHINVIGFLPDEIKLCIEKTLTEKPKAESLIRELESRQDVLSLCYIPLVCSIVIYVYDKNNKLPDTLTQLYEELILQIIRRYFKKTGKNARLVASLHMLPHDISQTFDKLCHFAYEGLSSENPRMTYSLNQISVSLEEQVDKGFRLITSFTFYDEELYQFIHLTIQEFFAAWWICKQKDVVKVFGKCWKKLHFRMCSRFIAGLSGLKDSAYAKYFKELSDLQCRRSVSDIDVFSVPSFYPSIGSLYDSDSCNERKSELQDLVYSNSTDHQLINVCNKNSINIYLLQLIYESQNKALCNTVAESFTDASLCFVLRHVHKQNMTAFDYNCISFFIRANTEITWKHLHLNEYHPLVVDHIKARSIKMSSKCIASTIASTVDINQLEELYYDSCIGQLDMLSLLQSTTLKVLEVEIDPSQLQWRDGHVNANIEGWIIDNKTLRVLSVGFNTSSCSSNLYEKLCSGIAKNKTLLSVKLWWAQGYGDKPRLSGLPVIFKENSTIQSFTTNAILEDEYVAEVNTPLKVLHVHHYMSWFTKCTQLQYLKLDWHIDGTTMTSLLTIIDHLQTLDVYIQDDDAYTILCDHLRRNNSTLKTLILFSSRNDRCASQLQDMLSVNTTLLGLKIHSLKPDHYKYITAGLNNNSSLKHLCLNTYIHSVFSFGDFSQLQTNLEYLQFETSTWHPNYNIVNIFQTILERNTNLRTLFVNNFLFQEQSVSISDLESFWRVVLQHPSLDKYIFPSSKKLLQARKKIMKELKVSLSVCT